MRRMTPRGFTMVELIIIIIVLAIIGKYVVSRSIDVSTSARQNSTQSIAAALAAASAENYAKRSASSTQGISITNCQTVTSALPDGTLPTGYSITSLTVANGATVTCTLNGTGGTSNTFQGLGIN